MIQHRVLGIDCYVGDLDSAAAMIIDRAVTGGGGTVCLANVHVVVTARRDLSLRGALQNAWLVLPDGAPLAWVQRRGGKDASRVAGADLLLAVMDRGRSRNLRHFLFGATPAVLTDLEANLKTKYPGVQIVGRYAPQPAMENARASLREVLETEPHIVWTALGAPKQEIWAERHSSTMGSMVAISVGAAFDFHAGNKPRAPRWMQHSGLEWLHRLSQEPRRLAGRYFRTNLEFIVLYAMEWIRCRVGQVTHWSRV